MTAAPASALWDAGWYHFAHRHASPNFGPRPAGAVVDLVVLHSISLPPGVFGGDAVRQLFTNTLDWDAHPYFQQIRGAPKLAPKTALAVGDWRTITTLAKKVSALGRG